MLLSKTEEVANFCASLKGEAFVTVDTEFMRERTYWAKLCLVQLGGSKEAVGIDPLAEGIDLTPLYDLMADQSILKVFHAARQDVEIFFHAAGHVPAPLFDTQVAAMVCGFGEAASYETLCDKLAKAKIDKSSRFTDWAQRPLTDKQVTYALGDVTHLRVVYEKLQAMLEKAGRAEWVREEMAILTSSDTYTVEPREIWKRLKLRADKPRLRAALRELAAWRETEAQRADIPRSRVMKDETMLEIAHHTPLNVQDLARTRGLSNGWAEGRHGAEILAAVARAKAIPLDECPEGHPKRIWPNGSGAVYDLLKVLLKQVSEEHDVAMKLIATSDELEIIATEPDPQTPALNGWRREIFGNLAIALKKGELAMTVKGGKIVVLKT